MKGEEPAWRIGTARLGRPVWDGPFGTARLGWTWRGDPALPDCTVKIVPTGAVFVGTALSAAMWCSHILQYCAAISQRRSLPVPPCSYRCGWRFINHSTLKIQHCLWGYAVILTQVRISVLGAVFIASFLTLHPSQSLSARYRGEPGMTAKGRSSVSI